MEKPMNADQMKLFEDNLRLVPYMARRYGHSVMPLLDDRLQAARLGLWRAVRGYDPAKEVRLVTYAIKVMVRTIRRTGKQERDKVPMLLIEDLQEQIRARRPSHRTYTLRRALADCGNDPESHAMSAAYFAAASCVLIHSRKGATWTAVDVAHMLAQGMRQADVARALHISRERVRQIVNDIHAECVKEGVVE